LMEISTISNIYMSVKIIDVSLMVPNISHKSFLKIS
jgi:hypothetical protein